MSTQYNGFGGTINGAPEIFVGSTGFANIRVGDRVEVRGIGHGNSAIRAERVTLLGRARPGAADRRRTDAHADFDLHADRLRHDAEHARRTASAASKA